MHLDADCDPPLLEDTPAMLINHTLYYIDKLKDKNYVIIPIAMKKNLTKFNIILWQNSILSDFFFPHLLE